MTLFRDVIKPLLDGLDNLNVKTRAAVLQYDHDTTSFQNYITAGVNGIQGSISFLGQGATACIAAVNRNVSRAQHGITKLGDFQLACDQTKKSLEEMTSSFDVQSNYYLKNSDLFGSLYNVSADPNETSLGDYFLVSQGYSPYDTTDYSEIIVWRIREDTLPGLYFNIDSLLTPGKGQGILEDGVNYAVSCIQRDFQTFQAQKHSDLDARYHSGNIDNGAYTVYSTTVDGMYQLAMHYVNIIAEKMRRGYTEWATELQAIVEQFKTDVTTASDVKSLSIGDLTTEINTGPYQNAKVIVLQTPNGLVVVVKGGVDAATVESLIQQYLQEHNLSSKTAITMFGYKDGGAAAQQVILDNAYAVNNLVLVGAVLQDNLPVTLNKFVYEAQPDSSPEKEATFLGLKPDQILIPLAVVAVGFLTDGIGEAGLLPYLASTGVDVGTEYGLSEVWNAAAQNWNTTHPNEPMPMATSPLVIYINNGDGTGIHKMTATDISLLANGKLPGAKIYLQQESIVPKESGANMDNFSNSSYLNSQPIPDPAPLPHGGSLPVNG